jgi:hypothetical protein
LTWAVFPFFPMIDLSLNHVVLVDSS